MNIKNTLKFTLKLQNAVKATLKEKEVSANEKDILKEGSAEIYTNELVPLLLQLPKNPQKLFWILVEERDEWNQVYKSREEMGSIYMKNYHKSNFSHDINRLMKLEMVAIIGYVPTISPFLVLPKNTLQMQKAIQVVWRELAHK